MLTPFVRRLALAAIIPLAASCASKDYPASPVPAPLSDLQAARLADAYQVAHMSPPMVLHSAEPQCDGYLLAYETALDVAGAPPKQSHLFLVRHDGSVREIKFKENQ